MRQISLIPGIPVLLGGSSVARKREDRGVPTYLAECYWRAAPRSPGEEPPGVEQRGREGILIRDVSCTLIPDEEVVFSVYAAQSADAVRQLNERAGLPVSRIVEAIAM